MLRAIAIASLGIALVCALAIAFDIVAGRRQKMWIMNLVWPISALYGGPVVLWAYWRIGRRQGGKPFWQQAALGTTHCGAGCTLGDICAEWFVHFVPLTLFGMTLFAAWTVDFALAFVFGIAFQYYGSHKGLIAALKADTLSLSAWQLGMYGWMAIAIFLIFGHPLEKTDPVFWFMMQIAMFAGFATSYPVNRWLLRAGIKEAM